MGDRFHGKPHEMGQLLKWTSSDPGFPAAFPIAEDASTDSEAEEPVGEAGSRGHA